MTACCMERDRSVVYGSFGVQDRQWEPSEHRRKQASELAETNIKSWGFTWCMVLNDAPRTAREMAVDFCGPSHRSFELVCRCMWHVFTYFCPFGGHWCYVADLLVMNARRCCCELYDDTVIIIADGRISWTSSSAIELL
jgi:hypothetical protein